MLLLVVRLLHHAIVSIPHLTEQPSSCGWLSTTGIEKASLCWSGALLLHHTGLLPEFLDLLALQAPDPLDVHFALVGHLVVLYGLVVHYTDLLQSHSSEFGAVVD